MTPAALLRQRYPRREQLRAFIAARLRAHPPIGEKMAEASIDLAVAQCERAVEFLRDLGANEALERVRAVLDG